MAQCVMDARLEGMQTLECVATLNAVPFYAAFGSVETERSSPTLGTSNEFPVVTMTLNLERRKGGRMTGPLSLSRNRGAQITRGCP